MISYLEKLKLGLMRKLRELILGENMTQARNSLSK